eukprot:CAMPEP_0177681330 /NCGR_PEP_ID=MMETSP0447-20121125/30659_1 /TAXON_ID=0 /ORGANISM="Stygamoeba regulata, Strain BSH-02190019" /LENGTH=256 /DNA_ID=CAMNT_0019190741 /DNA_START=118 /DNA_END=888 /DNA_ORIENTATION=-
MSDAEEFDLPPDEEVIFGATKFSDIEADWQRNYSECNHYRIHPLFERPPRINDTFEAYLPPDFSPSIMEPSPPGVTSWVEKMGAGVGLSFLTGAGLGGTRGLIRVSAGLPARLRLNSVLNHGGRTGSKLANTLGGAALILYMSALGTQYIRRRNDLLNYAPCGAVIGCLAGIRRGLYTTLGGTAIGAAAGVLGVGAIQYFSGDSVYPQLKPLGIDFDSMLPSWTDGLQDDDGYVPLDMDPEERQDMAEYFREDDEE